MKFKKYSYLIVLILMLLIGVKDVSAESSKKCYYISSQNDFKATLKISWGYGGRFFNTLDDYAAVRVDKTGENSFEMNKEPLVNWWDGGLNNWYDQCTKNDGVCFEPFYKSERKANEAKDPSCPKYLVFQYCSLYYVWGTDSEAQAKKAYDSIKAQGCTARYASANNKDGSLITEDDYYAEFDFEGIIDTNQNQQVDCREYDSIFGDKNDPKSIRGLMTTGLDYIRVIVPILIILLGTLDLSKAVIAGKEDAIKKAQTDFIKRVIIGVAVFFVPLLVDVVMYLADIVWNGEYVHCNL